MIPTPFVNNSGTNPTDPMAVKSIGITYEIQCIFASFRHCSCRFCLGFGTALRTVLESCGHPSPADAVGDTNGGHHRKLPS